MPIAQHLLLQAVIGGTQANEPLLESFDATSLRRRAMRLFCGLTKGCLVLLMHGANGLMGRRAMPIDQRIHQAVRRVGDACIEFRNSPVVAPQS